MQLSLVWQRFAFLTHRYRPLLFGLLLSLSIVQSTAAQEQLGWHLQRHAGINGIVLNPARTAIYPYRWDVNLVEDNAFFATDYAYLEETSFLRFLREPPQNANFYARSQIADGSKLPPNSYVLDFYDLRRKGYLAARTDPMGPSFSFRINDRHSIGFFTRARAWVGTQNIPTDLSYYRFFNTPFNEDIEVTPFLVNYLGWAEVGLNYSLSLPTADGTLSLGISVKSLTGYEGGYIENEKSFDLVKLPNDSLGGTDFILSGALANANTKSSDYQLQAQGRGLGVDLGALYTIDDRDGGYHWLFGVSILDIGRIGFDGDSEVHRIVGTQYTSLGAVDYNDISGPEDITGKIRLFSQQALGNPNESLLGNGYKQWLPTAISLQADRHFGNGWYTSAVLVQGLPLSGQAPRRGSLLAVVPRLEKRWYAVSLPVSVYNWDLMRVGLAARLAFLTLGTDDLGSWLVRKNFSSGDFYVALKVPFFSLSGNGGGAPRARRGGNNLDCYKF